MSNTTNGDLLGQLRSPQSRILVLRAWILLALSGTVATIIRTGGHDGPYTFLGRPYEDILLSVLPHALLVIPASIALVRDSRVANKLVRIMSWLTLFGVLMALQTRHSGATIKVLGAYVYSPVLPVSIAAVLLILAIWTTFAINKNTLPPAAIVS